MDCKMCNDIRYILSSNEAGEPDLQKCDDCHANKRDGYFTSDTQAKSYVSEYISEAD